jgi:hypothetical protein
MRFQMPPLERPKREPRQRLIVAHEWQGIPAGLCGDFLEQAGDYIRLRLDEPLPLFRGHTVRAVKVHIACVRPLSPLEQLAEVAE